jgi:hypothetical protein
MTQSSNTVTPLVFPQHIHRKAQIPKRALCVSLEGLAERAERGDTRAQELLIESLVYLERHLVAE